MPVESWSPAWHPLGIGHKLVRSTWIGQLHLVTSKGRAPTLGLYVRTPTCVISQNLESTCTASGDRRGQNLLRSASTYARRVGVDMRARARCPPIPVPTTVVSMRPWASVRLLAAPQKHMCAPPGRIACAAACRPPVHESAHRCARTYGAARRPGPAAAREEKAKLAIDI